MAIHEEQPIEEEEVEEETVEIDTPFPFSHIPPPGLPWTDTLKWHMANFEKYKPKDRLDYFDAIAKYVAVMGMSIAGWRQWIEQLVLATFSEEELKTIYANFKEHGIPLLKLDHDITETFQKKTNTTEKRTMINPAGDGSKTSKYTS